jgi:hypothetical protein
MKGSEISLRYLDKEQIIVVVIYSENEQKQNYCYRAGLFSQAWAHTLLELELELGPDNPRRSWKLEPLHNARIQLRDRKFVKLTEPQLLSAIHDIMMQSREGLLNPAILN